MPVRLSSSSPNAEGTAWSPTAELMLQFDMPNGVSVEVIGRVDAAADWSIIETVNYDDDKFLRVAQVPFLNVRLKGTPGSLVRVWSDS